MATLHIYADESGTMPVKDSDDAFVAVAIAFWNSPTPINFKGHQTWVAQKLKDMKAMLAVAYVAPYKGYQVALDAKHDELNQKGLIAKKWAGNRFVGEHGISKRNLIWVYAISYVVTLATVGGLKSKAIRTLDILLHQKTLDSGLRDLLIQEITTMRDRVIHATFPSFYPVTRLAETYVIDEIIGRAQYTPSRIQIHTSDERETISDRVGLKFADYFAGKAHKALKGNQLVNFSNSWEQRIASVDCINLTKSLIQDIHQDVKRTWENNTKLSTYISSEKE